MAATADTTQQPNSGEIETPAGYVSESIILLSFSCRLKMKLDEASDRTGATAQSSSCCCIVQAAPEVSWSPSSGPLTAGHIFC